MKLSEAIRLGSTLGPQTFESIGGKTGTCAIGAARLAVGKMRERSGHVWPWIVAGRVFCPACRKRHSDALGTVFCLNDDHRWTRERIADWVATIEPEEVQASETNGQCSLGKGPIRPSPEEETAVMKIG